MEQDSALRSAGAAGWDSALHRAVPVPQVPKGVQVMNAKIDRLWDASHSSKITSVVLEVIYPNQQVDVSVDDLQFHIGEYGELKYNGSPARLVGVRLSDHPNTVSYAGCYWYIREDFKVTTWNLYIGVSRASGLRYTRIF